ncbi:unnamed protein product [Dimorphilus gyrociliatus]|uniref:Uncharacterized protein n=1 Tax=Dimorphilus gyrociliatus TaxID=2664684 RepID=A0A7I8VDY0_9ANNE|nr:unnamed protein product [Dimorphilus gyrociliatus]
MSTHYCSIRQLELVEAQFNEKSACFLRNYIEKNQTEMKALNFRGIDLRHSIGLEMFNVSVCSLSILCQLDIISCKLSEDMSLCLGKFISNQLKLKILNIQSSSLDGKIGENLFKTLSDSCYSLEKFSLFNTNLSEQAVSLLGMTISNQTQLKSLCLRQTNFAGRIGKSLLLCNSYVRSTVQQFKLSLTEFSAIIDTELGESASDQSNFKEIVCKDINFDEDIKENILQKLNTTCVSVEIINISSTEMNVNTSEILIIFICNQMNLQNLTLCNIIIKNNGIIEDKLSEDINFPSSLHEVQFQKCDLCIVKSKIMGRFLSFQMHLLKINFSNMKLEGNVGENIFKGLSNNCSSIEDLNLTNVQLCQRSASYLGNLINRQTNLKILCLKNINLEGLIGVNLFKNSNQSTSLKKLCMSYCKFDSEMTRHLQKFIANQRKLISIDLRNTKLTDERGAGEIFHNISATCSLIEILLNGICLGEMAANKLGLFISYQTNLKILELDKVKFEGIVGENLFSNLLNTSNFIRKLDFRNINFTTTLASHLGKFINNQKFLKTLILKGNNLKGEIGENLFKSMSSSCCSLEIIDISGCKLSEKTSSYLGKFLSYQTNLIGLNREKIEFEGRSEEFLFGEMKSLCSLIKKLDFRNGNYRENAAIIILKFVFNQSHLEFLYIENTILEASDGIGRFETLPLHLTEIRLKGSVISEYLASYIGKLIGNQMKMKELNLSKAKLEGRVGENLFKNISNCCCFLKELDLSYTKISSQAAYYLRLFIEKQTVLESLDLSHMNLGMEIGSTLFNNLHEHLSFLRKLSLQKSILDENMVRYLGEFIGNQINLYMINFGEVDFCGNLGEILFSNISSSCSSVEILDLSNAKLDSTAAKYLGIFIRNQYGLKTLSFENTDLSASIGENLFWSLESSCSSLSAFNFQNSNICHATAPCIGKFLSLQKKLRVLNFDNAFSAEIVGERIFKTITEDCCWIEYLNLNHICLNEQSAYNLGKIISNQRHLLMISLKEINLNGSIGGSLFKGMFGASVEAISLSDIAIDFYAVEKLGEFLKSQRIMQSIIFDFKLDSESKNHLLDVISNLQYNLESFGLDPNFNKE